MFWIDSHSHFDAPEFDHDRASVLARAQAAGVCAQVLPAVTAGAWPKLKSVCVQFPGLHPAYGLHPMFLDNHEDAHLALLEDWLQAERPIAVGECGLDFFVEGLDPERQREFFTRQLRMAREHQLPVIVHARRAVDEVIRLIRLHKVTGGVVHSFSGSAEQARQLFDLGFCLGIGGPVTYERAKRLRDIVRSMPGEFLLLETDSPDQPLCGRQGERNEPVRLLDVARVVADLRESSMQDLAELNNTNAARVFGSRLMPPYPSQNSTPH